MNEADVPVFAGGNARDHLAPGNLGIYHGLAPAPSIIDHHDEILQWRGSPSPLERGQRMRPIISENQK
jgi:hypothetical protein